MATVRARALSLGVLLVLALCLTPCGAEQQPTNRYISYAPLPRTAGAPRGNGHSVLWRCKDCHGQPPMNAAIDTAATATEFKGIDINPAVAATMTGAKTVAKGAYFSPAALSEEKERYISYWALLQNQPKGIPHKRGKCPRRPCA